MAANIKFRVQYSQQYLCNTIPDTNHNANPTNPNHNSKGRPSPNNRTNPSNPNTRYHCEYGTLNSKSAQNGTNSVTRFRSNESFVIF